MADLTLIFEFKINSSVKVGDKAYYAPTTDNSGFKVASEPVLIGVITTINAFNKSTLTQSIVCDWQGVNLPANNNYIFFSKNNEVEVSSIRGYFGLAKFTNNSTSVGELFSVDCGVSRSSK